MDAKTYDMIVKEARKDARILVKVQTIPVPKKSTSFNSVRGDENPNALIAIVTLDDPSNFNALSPKLMTQLQDRLLELNSNPSVKVAIITGNDPAFCSGGHLQMIARHSHEISDPKH